MKRPLRSAAFVNDKLVRKGRATTLQGGIVSATRRMLRQRITQVEITNSNEQLLVTIYKVYSNNAMSLVTVFEQRAASYLRKHP